MSLTEIIIRDCVRSYTRNTEARSRNHCCYGKAIFIFYSQCLSVALDIQHAMGVHRIVGHPGPV